MTEDQFGKTLQVGKFSLQIQFSKRSAWITLIELVVTWGIAYLVLWLGDQFAPSQPWWVILIVALVAGFGTASLVKCLLSRRTVG